jgi:hypothetical protein
VKVAVIMVKLDVNDKSTNGSFNGKVKSDRKIAFITGITGQVFNSHFITIFHHFIYQFSNIEILLVTILIYFID